MQTATCNNRLMPAKKPPKSVSPHRQAFANRLSAARIASGFETMRDFSEALGISEARYRRWEAAETEPDLMHLQKIARITGVSLDVLISGQRPSHNAA
jgi:transcriptional regulator with XRE-family HTH domain